jgi:hypothetical protein
VHHVQQAQDLLLVQVYLIYMEMTMVLLHLDEE